MSFDPTPILSKLKPFQRATVDYVMKRFESGAQRFLVADEVGLGKTRVAQGVVGLTLAGLRADKRADIIYVCSNSAIARQNLRLLNVLQNEEIRATRLTLLCADSAGLRRKGANFIALTPGTSFDRTGGLGRAEERALVCKFLAGRIPAPMLNKLLMHPVQKRDRWMNYLEQVHPAGDLAPVANILLADGMATTISTCNLGDPGARSRIVRELLLRLARHALTSLRPRLVIFDEFQRFRDLFAEGDSEAQALMRTFLEAESWGARVLFLSATPYKLLTLDREEADGEDHHADFLKTVSILYGAEGPTAAEGLRKEIRDFRGFLGRLAAELDPAIHEVRSSVEGRLRRVMSRQERVSSDSADGDIRRTMITTTVEASDLRQARAVDQVAREVMARHHVVEYWKSAPYLFSFMGDYDLARNIRQFQDRGKLARSGAGAMVPASSRQKFQPIPPGNGRMRALFEQVFEKTDLYRRLWLPPALAYLKGSRRHTKSLIFSDWQMVPEAVAALISYEAERRLRQEEKLNGAPKKREPPSLPLRSDSGHLGASMKIMTLLYPSAFLARVVDPLAIWRAKGVMTRREMIEESERLIAAALAEISVPQSEGDVPWEVLPDLDASETDWFSEIRKGLRAGTAKSTKRNRKNQSPAVACLDHFILSRPELKRRPASKLTIRFLAKVALGSPATCLLRSFTRHVDVPAAARAGMAAEVAMGFLTLFNKRETGPLFIRGGPDGAWSHALDYCAGHDLQAVLDEYVFQITNGLLTAGKEEGRPAHQVLAERVRKTVGLHTAPITLHNPFERLQRTNRTMPSHLAARFAENAIQDRDGNSAHIDTLRNAFNSPFRPFVLASTSVGQEGLDFHLYCHHLWHWNIPSNPVDLEQREGRVQRYLNHAVRLNIATNHADAARVAHGAAWNAMLAAAETEVAERGTSRNGLRPHWLYAGDAPDPVKIETFFLLPTLSRDVQKADRLMRTTALYRLAFGQPRQSDLLAMLHATDITLSMRDKLLINLAPPIAVGDLRSLT